MVSVSRGWALPHFENSVLSHEQMAGLMSLSMFASLGGPEAQSEDSVLATFGRLFDLGALPPTLEEIKAAYIYNFPEESAEEEMRSWRKVWATVARGRAKCRRREARLPLLACRRRYNAYEYKRHPEYGVADKMMRMAEKLPVSELRTVAAKLLALAAEKESPRPCDLAAEAEIARGIVALAAETDDWIQAERSIAALRPPPPPPPPYDPLANGVLLSGKEIHARIMGHFEASDAARSNVIVKLARPFSGEDDLFKHMVSFL